MATVTPFDNGVEAFSFFHSLCVYSEHATPGNSFWDSESMHTSAYRVFLMVTIIMQVICVCFHSQGRHISTAMSRRSKSSKSKKRVIFTPLKSNTSGKHNLYDFFYL